MAHSNLVALVTGISLYGVNLPPLSAAERAHGKVDVQAKASVEKGKEGPSPTITEAIEQYQDRLRQIYQANGKEETTLLAQMSRFYEAAENVARALDPAFDKNAFLSLSLVDQVNYLSIVFHQHGYILGNLDVTAESRDGSRAVLSLTLDKVHATESLTCGKFDFTTIGNASNPLPATLPLFETSSLVCEAEGVATLAPLSVIALDLNKKTYALILAHDTMLTFLPGYDPAKGNGLDPAVRTFLTHWAVGRLAFHAGGEQGSCSLPQALNVNGHAVPLRGLMGLAYAFEQSSDNSSQLATIICNYLGISSSVPDNYLLDMGSRLIRKRLDKSFPGIDSLQDAKGAKLFFDQNPDAAKAYLDALRQMVLKQVESIKDEVLKRGSRTRPSFSI